MNALRIALMTVVLGVAVSASAKAQTSVSASCKDGSNWAGAQRSGACRGHGGVQAFNPASTTTNVALTPPASTTPGQPNAPTQERPGGRAGQVWVNTASKVYHCPGDRYYGKTKAGAYMTESAAKSAGDRPDHGKSCS